MTSPRVQVPVGSLALRLNFRVEMGLRSIESPVSSMLCRSVSIIFCFSSSSAISWKDRNRWVRQNRGSGAGAYISQYFCKNTATRSLWHKGLREVQDLAVRDKLKSQFSIIGAKGSVFEISLLRLHF